MSEKRVLILRDQGPLCSFVRAKLAAEGFAADVPWQKSAMQSYDVALCWDAEYAAHLSARCPHLHVLPRRQKRTSIAKLAAAVRKLRNAPH